MRPQANGCVERFNRTLVSMMKMYCQDNQNNWDEYLPQLHCSGVPNLLTNSFTKVVATVFASWSGSGRASVHFVNKSDNREISTTEYIENLQQILNYTHSYARKHLKESNEYQKKHYAQGAISLLSFSGSLMKA
jgi:hypothetical protein